MQDAATSTITSATAEATRFTSLTAVGASDEGARLHDTFTLKLHADLPRG